METPIHKLQSFATPATASASELTASDTLLKTIMPAIAKGKKK
ncbi:hypothetical protein [Lacticaseibacillus manihotivorans]|nr:hypothetical protein [Lacticaseibacillus manihotivorans]